MVTTIWTLINGNCLPVGPGVILNWSEKSREAKGVNGKFDHFENDPKIGV